MLRPSDTHVSRSEQVVEKFRSTTRMEPNPPVDEWFLVVHIGIVTIVQSPRGAEASCIHHVGLLGEPSC